MLKSIYPKAVTGKSKFRNTKIKFAVYSSFRGGITLKSINQSLQMESV